MSISAYCISESTTKLMGRVLVAIGRFTKIVPTPILENTIDTNVDVEFAKQEAYKKRIGAQARTM